MDNTFIPQAIKIVSKAIAADNAGEWETAVGLHHTILE
jgi:hypothetical protein